MNQGELGVRGGCTERHGSPSLSAAFRARHPRPWALPGRRGPGWAPLLLLLPLLLFPPLPARAAGPLADAKEQANFATRPTVTLASPAPGEPLPEGYTADARGRRFRVRFDAGSRVLLGAGLAFGGAAEDAGRSRQRLQLGLSYRSALLFADGDEQVTWQLDHALLAGTIEPANPGHASLPATDATLYRAVYLRHASSSTITLPSNPPRQLYFPLDLGVQAVLGRVQWPGEPRPDEAGSPRVVRLELAQASVLLDPWRSGRPGCSLELGVGSRYGLDLLYPATGPWSSPQRVHRLAPFTATSLRLRLQDAAGLTVADLRGELVPHWASRGGWQTAAEAQARLERVLVALNDEPLAAFAELRWSRWPGPSPQQGELQALAGLALLWQLK